MNTPELETERLRLRRFTAEDAAAILAIFGDVEANTFLPWFPLKSLEEARQLFERQYQPVYRAERGYQYAICHEFWHRGIAAEATRALVEQVRRDGLPYLTATHDVNNPNSGAVMKKLGMVYQYSYEEQWQPKDIPVLFRLYQMDLDGNSGRPYLRYWEQSRVHMVEQGI